MKYDIWSISISMFWHFPVVLDLDTGETHTVYDAATAGAVEKLKNKKKIPHYSEAAIYQKYLETAQDVGAVDIGNLLERHPHFELVPEPDPKTVGEHYRESKEVVAFYREADPICDSLCASDLILPIEDFLEEFEVQFAKKWCTKEGIEWYDDRPASRHHVLPLDMAD